MNDAASGRISLTSPAGCTVVLNANGSVRRFDCGAVSLTLFPGSELEGGPANLYLRILGGARAGTALLGPRSRTQWRADSERLIGTGSWSGVDYQVVLRLAAATPAWFWHVRLHNPGGQALRVDLTYVQDLALAPYGAVRMNEYYVSQYVDHAPLQHPEHGVLIASRQNQPVEGRHPWCLIGSLRRAAHFGTDALQWSGLAARSDAPAPALRDELPDRRLQHEHSMVIVRDAPLQLPPGEAVAAGFFGEFVADHPAASAPEDLSRVAAALALPEARPQPVAAAGPGRMASGPHETGAVSQASWFSAAPLLPVLEADEGLLQEWFPGPWRHVERDPDGTLLSFFHAQASHVVLRAKELRVLRPHGQLLRSGLHLTPDETALTSTAWMGGVFHSMVTQGHASLNRFLSATHSYLGLFRAQGQRVFVQLGEHWRLLGTPTLFEMQPERCRWIYRCADRILCVTAAVEHAPQALTLSIEVRSGEPLRCLVFHGIALDGDDGLAGGAVSWHRDGEDLVLAPAPGSELARRCPGGTFRIQPQQGTRFERIGGDELLYADGRSRAEPALCLLSAPATRTALRILGELIGPAAQPPLRAVAAELQPAWRLTPPPGSALAEPVARLDDIVPWFAHDALVHYLAPRGLEQYTGGGWGTRDVCQGPVELLLTLGRTRALREVLLRVMAQQNPDGDWPQWFMIFERDGAIRAADSHGDIVLWPLVVLGQYLSASGDAGVLEERVGFGGRPPRAPADSASVWEHVRRALALTERRVIAGTALLAYGHGDWNDSLQPLDPHLREQLCSAWTVTLHVQALRTLAQGLQLIGRAADAAPLQARAASVERDFQRLLLVDGVLAGYARFDEGTAPGRVSYLLHPRDASTGVHYSSLAMVHAILEDLLTPAQARAHLAIIDAHLSGPDGLRLFDRPMPYRGGTQRLFQRAESAAYFGREIGLMYMHAHLRYAQALAHLGEARRFFRALCQANPIGVRTLVPGAALRQCNCYYSSSDAAFEDRYQASEQYERVRQGSIGLEGGWRVYSSGAGIALALIGRHLLGIGVGAEQLGIDPVVPPELDGLRAETSLLGRALTLSYRVGPAGCGVRTLRLNGAPLAFERGANAYRAGAAQLPLALLRERLDAGGNRLEIELG